MNPSTFNMNMNTADIDFDTFSIGDAVEVAQFWEDVNYVEIVEEED